jgi:RNA polymerase sigma-70 factor (ECF subfamily)
MTIGHGPTGGPAGAARADVDPWRVLAAQAGDRAAIEHVLESLAPIVTRRVASLIWRDPDIDDLVQDVLFTVWRKLPWLRDARLVVPWTLRIAARRVWRHTARERRGAAVRALFSRELAASPRAARDPGFDVDVAKALEAIPDVSPSSRVILTLHYVDGLPLAEVAEELGVSLGTAKSRLAYGLVQLRDRLGAIRS